MESVNSKMRTDLVSGVHCFCFVRQLLRSMEDVRSTLGVSLILFFRTLSGGFAVDSNKLDYGCRHIYAVFPSLVGVGLEGGQSHVPISF